MLVPDLITTFNTPPVVAVLFGAAAALQREFGDGVNRQHHAGNARHTALIDGIDVVPKIIVVGAVDLPVNAVEARAVEGAVGVGAGVELQQLREIAAIQRNVQDLLGVDQAGCGRRSGLNRYGLGRNLDGSGLFSHFQLQRDGGNPAGIHHYAGHVNRVKARLGDGDVVLAEREILKDEFSC